MNRRRLFYLFVFILFAGPGHINSLVFGEGITLIKIQDPIRENQILYNGKVWRNLYTYVKGNQFLFSNEYLPGSVTVNGKTYNNLNINYDIYNDEITTPKNKGTILQLNKEMVDSFSLIFEFKTYRFKNTDEDSLPGLKGFVNVLYDGKSSLYVKYKKEIDLLVVDNKYDLFSQTQKIYFLNNGVIFQLSGKRDLLKALQEDKARIKTFMKKNGIRVSKKVPGSFVPVIRYYDSLRQ